MDPALAFGSVRAIGLTIGKAWRPTGNRHLWGASPHWYWMQASWPPKRTTRQKGDRSNRTVAGPLLLRQGHPDDFGDRLCFSASVSSWCLLDNQARSCVEKTGSYLLPLPESGKGIEICSSSWRSADHSVRCDNSSFGCGGIFSHIKSERCDLLHTGHDR